MVASTRREREGKSGVGRAALREERSKAVAERIVVVRIFVSIVVCKKTLLEDVRVS
jgi:hypothetical protein